MVRPFEWGNLHVWTALYNDANGVSGSPEAYDLASMEKFLSQPRLDATNNCYMAYSKTEPIGYLIVWPEEGISRVVAEIVTVHSDSSIIAHEKSLINTAINRSISLGCQSLHIQSLEQDVPRRELLAASGFTEIQFYNTMSWSGHEAPPLELPVGVGVRSFRQGHDERELTELQNATFGDSWGFCPNTIKEIRARVDLRDTVPDGILFLTKGTQSISYNWTTRQAGPDGTLGKIAMTGVHPRERGRGLFLPTVIAGMRYLVSEGINTITLETNESNSSAQQVYTSLGFQHITRTIWCELRTAS